VVTVFAVQVRLAEGWFDMKLGKLVGAPVKAVGSLLDGIGIGGKKGVATPNMGGGLKNMVKAAEAKNALQEGQARVAPVKAPGMKKGGAVKKAKAKSRSASSRGDGCCRKGKTRGKIC